MKINHQKLTFYPQAGHVISWLLLFFAFAFLVRKLVIASSDHLIHGYIGYYAAARLLLENGWGPEAFDKAWFSGYTLSLSNGLVGEIITPNLPTIALLALPVAFLPLETGRIYWAWGNGVILALGLGGLCLIIQSLLRVNRYQEPKTETIPARNHRLFIRDHLLIFLVIFACFFPPVVRNIELGQAYLPIFFLLVLALYGLHNQKDWLTGVGLGLALALKLAGGLLWLIPLFHKRWKTLSWAAGSFVFSALITLPWIGLDTWLAYPSAFSKMTADPTLAATAYQSIPSLFTHLFQFHEFWSPQPLLHAPLVAKILITVLTILFIGITLWVIRNASIPLQVSALLTLNTILVPLVEEHQLVLMLIPIAVLATELLVHPPPTGWLSVTGFLFVSAVALLTLRFPYKSESLTLGWLAFLAYPRLYGCILLWVLSLKRVISL